MHMHIIISAFPRDNNKYARVHCSLRTFYAARNPLYNAQTFATLGDTNRPITLVAGSTQLQVSVI